jgi:VWFA-related protein
MSGFGSGAKKLIFVVLLAGLPMLAQQDLPDAPKPKVPAQQFPADTPPAPKNNHDQQPEAPATGTPANPGQATQTPPRQDGVLTDIGALETLKVNVNFVEIPVSVKDHNGRLVEGLTQRDFAVFEDGVQQRLSFFNSQAFPLSVAVVVDTDLPSETMKKINESLHALIGAFSDFDEVALYRYSATVQQVSGFTGASSISETTLARVKRTGREGGPAAAGGTISQVPMINGHPADPGAINPVYTSAPRELHVLNDAILRAANDLSRRPGVARRRIVFVISDGRESGSTAHYDEVKRVLLARNISVYGVGVDTSAMPIYDKLNRIRIPGQGYGNILPKYVVETAGDWSAEFSRDAIERAYARITEVARNQYTLGFNTRVTPASNCRELVVNVHRPDLIVRSRPSYCPLPPQKQ